MNGEIGTTESIQVFNPGKDKQRVEKGFQKWTFVSVSTATVHNDIREGEQNLNESSIPW